MPPQASLHKNEIHWHFCRMVPTNSALPFHQGQVSGMVDDLTSCDKKKMPVNLIFV